MTAPLKSICVFCGARSGTNPAHIAAAVAMGRAIATNGWRLVYGAGDIGLMGEVARSAQAAGAQTMGVIPVHLIDQEVGKRDLTQFVITQDMHERKKVMFMNCDAIVVLPGGAGSLEVFRSADLGADRPAQKADLSGQYRRLLAAADRPPGSHRGAGLCRPDGAFALRCRA